MKNVIITFLLSFVLGTIYAQDFSMANDTLTTPKGYKIYTGSEITFGTGTLPDGKFKYITVNPKNKFDTNGHFFIGLTEDALPKAWEHHKKVIKGFRNVNGYYTAKISIGLSGYFIDLDSAIESGEIVVAGYENAPKNPRKDPMKPSKTKTSSTIADDLKKLSDLHDKGILTDEEFKRAKEKLLNE